MVSDDVIIMALVSQRVGSMLSNAVVSMSHHFSDTLTEEPAVRLHIANIGDRAGKVYPAIVEADVYGYVLYGQDGVNRRILLRCSRDTKSGNFSIEDGEFAPELLSLG